MNSDIVKKLIFSQNMDDNILGYSYLQHYSIKELKDILGITPGNPWKITRNGSELQPPYIRSRNYLLGDKYHVHDYGYVAYFYAGISGLHDYIQL